MIPTQEMTPYPVFGDNAIKTPPDDPKYAAGFQAGDVLPAEWLNFFLSRASGAITKLNPGLLSVEQELNALLSRGGQTPDAGATTQVVTAVLQLITEAILEEQQKPAVGVPTLWMSTKPDWALDFGNGAATKYLWSNYPKLNNDKFKTILATLATEGWMTAHDAEGFYVPDLRGVVPVGYGTNAKRTGETTAGGTLGQYLASANKSHSHSVNATNRTSGGMTANATHSHSMNGSDADTDGNYIQGSGKNNSSARVTNSANLAHTHITSCYVTINNEGSVSKPPTIGLMWIVRYI